MSYCQYKKAIPTHDTVPVSDGNIYHQGCAPPSLARKNGCDSYGLLGNLLDATCMMPACI